MLILAEMQKNYLESLDKQFRYYKMLGERTMAQLTDEQLLWRPSPEGNSIGKIGKKTSKIQSQRDIS
ncbi:MAG: DUF1572 family protein, partial [Bacteroidota bacterium]